MNAHVSAGLRSGAEAAQGAGATRPVAGIGGRVSGHAPAAEGAGKATASDGPRRTGGQDSAQSPTAVSRAIKPRRSRHSTASPGVRDSSLAATAGHTGAAPAPGSDGSAVAQGDSTEAGRRQEISPRRPLPPKCYRMAEVVEYSGMSRQTIHNYTTMGLICEVCRTKGGHRLYGEDVFGRLDLIAELKRQNHTMREIRRRFRELEATA